MITTISDRERELMAQVEALKDQLRAYSTRQFSNLSNQAHGFSTFGGCPSCGKLDCIARSCTAAQSLNTTPMTNVIDWPAVGRIIETHYRLRGIQTAGTSNWGAAIWKAAHGVKEVQS